MIDVKLVTQPNFPAIERKINTKFNNNFIKLTKLGAEYLTRIIPKKTGKMKGSIGYDNNEIWTTSDKYRYVDDGTKPHRIEGLLRFRISGVVIFSQGVDHPGTKAQHLTDKTVKKIDNYMPVFVRHINAAIP